MLWSQPEMLPWEGRGRKQDGQSYGREVGSKRTVLCPHQQQQQAPWQFSGSSSSLSYQAKCLLPCHFTPPARRYICMVDEPGPVCTSAMPRSLLLCLAVLVESQEQWIWELKVIRTREDVPVSAQAFATVVTPMRPLVP